jgi:hypothetical protein
MKIQEGTVGTALPVLVVNHRLADPSVLWTPLREHGAVLLRGAAFSAAAFEAATAPFA